MTRPSTASVTMSTTTVPPFCTPLPLLYYDYLRSCACRLPSCHGLSLASSGPSNGKHRTAITASHFPLLLSSVGGDLQRQRAREREREKDLAAGSSRQSRCLTLASSPSSSLSEGRHLTHDADSVSLRVPHPAASLLRPSACLSGHSALPSQLCPALECVDACSLRLFFISCFLYFSHIILFLCSNCKN